MLFIGISAAFLICGIIVLQVNGSGFNTYFIAALLEVLLFFLLSYRNHKKATDGYELYLEQFTLISNGQTIRSFENIYIKDGSYYVFARVPGVPVLAFKYVPIKVELYRV